MDKDKTIKMQVIATIQSDFSSKFGIPRQSGLVEELQAKIIFEKKYRNPDAVRGIEGFDYIWILWEFSECVKEEWSPMVNPPRMGKNQRMGVFATRSPYRPNPIGLSCVKLDGVEYTEEYGPVLHVRGADLLNGTPIFDIKPYLPYADAHPEASGGFATQYLGDVLTVEIADQWLSMIPKDKRDALVGVLEQDPRPAYTKFPDRVFGLEFAGFDVRFRVVDRKLEVVEIVCL